MLAKQTYCLELQNTELSTQGRRLLEERILTLWPPTRTLGNLRSTKTIVLMLLIQGNHLSIYDRGFLLAFYLYILSYLHKGNVYLRVDAVR